MRRTLTTALAASLLVAAPLAACSSDDDADDVVPETGERGTPSESAAEGGDGDVLTILVTNDDGVGAEGIAELADALAALPDTEVTVVAPAENQSGSAGNTTDGELEATDAETATGMAATAVDGFPADSVAWAFDDGLDELPDLVVSGVNAGQNIGPFAELSGTVGAAREAASRGVPSLAVSSGLGDPVDYATAVDLAVEWVTEHRDELTAGADDAEGEAVITVWSINVPTCTEGEVRGLVEVPTADAVPDGVDVSTSDCTSTEEDPGDDVTAFVTGYASLSDVTPTP